MLAHWGREAFCCNMRWCSWINGTTKDSTMGLEISSRCVCASKTLSIKHTCVPVWPAGATTSANLSPTQHRTCCLSLPWTVKTGVHPWGEHLSGGLVSDNRSGEVIISEKQDLLCIFELSSRKNESKSRSVVFIFLVSVLPIHHYLNMPLLLNTNQTGKKRRMRMCVWKCLSHSG